MTRSRAWLAPLSALALAALALGCAGKPADAGVAERPPVAVETATVSPGALQETIAVVGALTPKFQAEVKTEYSGTVTEVLVTEWVRVAKGTILLRFDAREPEAAAKAAKAARLQAEVGATRGRRELERAQELKAAGLATQQNLDDAKSAAEAADAQLSAAQAQEEMAVARLSKCVIRAPMDGVVAARTVNPGDFIENMGSPRPMFRIVDNRRLELTVQVPSSKISQVQIGQPLSFVADAVPGRTFAGQVSFINPTADETSRAVRVVAVVDNADEALKAGLFVKGAIVTGARQGVLMVPRSALASWDPMAKTGFVFVVDGDKAQRQAITTGVVTDDAVEVASGLAGGQQVVTRGAFNVRDGDRVTVVPATGA